MHPMAKSISLLVNGQGYAVEVEPSDLLIDVARDKLGLTGAKKGCGTGDCGACTVILAGRAVTACLVLAMAAEGKPLETIEGLASGDRLHPLQQAFLDFNSVQCGYCIPGVLMMAKATLDANPRADADDIRRGLAGNLCRCTGYSKIIEAVKAAARATE